MRPPIRVPMWRGTPPALFPPILGLAGVALGWRLAAGPLPVPSGIGDLLLGMVALLYLYCAGCYVAKLIRRPGVLLHDLRTLPGRAGLPAATMTAMLLAAGLVPVAPGPAAALLWAGLALHAALALAVLYALASGPAEQRAITPAWHLVFVGFIVAPLAAVPLGHDGLASAILWATVPVAALVIGVSLARLARGAPPPPLRPLQAIHLAPLSLFGTAAVLLDRPGLALAFAALAALALAVLLGWARALTAAGFSPLWGAFTFPLAAFAGLMLRLAPQGTGFAVAGVIALVAASALVPWIALKVLRMWPPGTLAARTNAGVA